MGRMITGATAAALIVAALVGGAAAEGREPWGCTYGTIDAIYGYDMTGQPRLYEGQTLRYLAAAEDGTFLEFMSATPAHDALFDYLAAVLCDGFDPLAPVVAAEGAPVQEQTGPVWYGPRWR